MSLRLKAKVLLQYTKLIMIKVDIVYHSFVSIHISTHIHVYPCTYEHVYMCMCNAYVCKISNQKPKICGPLNWA